MAESRPALRIAIANDYEIVVAGLAAALEPFADRVRVVELDLRAEVVSDVDLVLYDTFGQVQGDGVDLADLVRDSGAKVVVFSWNLDRELVERTLAQGASGYLSKALTAKELVDQLEAVAAGQVVRPAAVDHDSDGAGDGVTDGAGERASWPGRQHGLTARESEVIALISQGLANQEIADTTYLSINSVKTYIRSAYRKIGVTSRSQAVIWGLQHGFEPDRGRRLDPRS